MASVSGILLIAALLLHSGTAFDILLFPAFTRVNQIFFESVETELRVVGHGVTFLVFQEHLGTRAPPPDAIIVPGGDAGTKLRKWELTAMEDWSEAAASSENSYGDALQRQCESLLGQTKILEAIRDHLRPNVVLADLRYGPCIMALGKLLKTSVIGVQASPLSSPYASSHVPSVVDRRSWKRSGIWDRLSIALESFFNTRRENNAAAVACQRVPTCRSGDDLYLDLSMVLINGFEAWDAPIRQVYPKLVFVGGLNFHTAVLLPKDLDDIAREYRAGIILVTLVSSISAQMFPDYVRNSIVTGLGRLPHAIFWRANISNANNLTSNMFSNEQFQSQNIMGHVRTRLVISFCDHDTVFAAMYHHVPLLCIPVLEDQVDLAKRVQKRGVGVVLNLPHLNPDSLLDAVQSIITNGSFRQRSRYHADLLRDQPNTASDRLVFWTKYVILRKGAFHLRNPALLLHLTVPDIGLLVMFAVLATAVTTWAACRLMGKQQVVNVNKTNKSKKKKSE